METQLDELFKLIPETQLRFLYTLDYFNYSENKLFVYNYCYGKIVRLIFDFYKLVALTKHQELPYI
jgi:hypothetical protein